VLRDVIYTFRLGYSVSVIRSTPESYVNGRVVPAAPSSFMVNTGDDDALSIVPSTGQTVGTSEQGEFGENTRRAYSMTELRARSSQGPGDQLTLTDGVYEVVASMAWSGLAGDGEQDCWECTLTKLTP
jgi:hypothetical protein